MKAQKQKARVPVMKNNLWMFRLIWKHTPFYVVWMIAEGIIWGINNSVGIIYTRNLLDALGRGAPFADIAPVILIYAVYILLLYLFHHWYWTVFNPRVREKLNIALHKTLFSQAVRMDLARYDDPQFYNDFVWAMDQSGTHASGLMEDTGKLINRIVASVTLTVVLFSIDPAAAAVLFVAAGIDILLQNIKNKQQLLYSTALNPLGRKAEYISRVFRLPDYAKEVRTTQVSEVLLREQRQNTEEVKAVKRKFGNRLFWIDALKMLNSTLGHGLPMLMILYQVMVSKTLGIGGFAIMVNALWTMSWLMGDLIDRLMKYHQHGLFIEKIRCFLQTEPEIQSGGESAPPFESLSLQNLTFAYPGKDASTLHKVQLDIRRGEKIAIVGYNGAGKTTLIKLLMRLYDPAEGEILYNGLPLSAYDTESLRRRIAAVFQDYRIFAAAVAENVVGGPYEDSRKEEVLDALEKSTFGDKLSSMPDGIMTPLTREFDANGTVLSGGEAQKIAIARAFYKDADLIILDEPSSALDPEAEYALNCAISDYAGDKTVVFISHRLSTTRNADRIYMFEDGNLAESGTHSELMEKKGKYAHMFNVQAEKYKSSASV